MIVLIFIPLGLVMGYTMYKIKSEFWAYIFGITPYLIFFLLSIDEREVWGHSRVIALFATAVACLYCFIARKIKESKEKRDHSRL